MGAIAKGDILFNQKELLDVLREIQESIKDKVEKVAEPKFQSMTDEEITQELFKKYATKPIEFVDIDNPHSKREDIEIDVRGDRSRVRRNTNRPVLLPGLKITRTYQFTGDWRLFFYRPSSRDSSPPRGHVEHKGTEYGKLNIIVEILQDELGDGEKVLQKCNSEFASIQKYISNQKTNIDFCNRQLESEIRDRVQDRKKRLGNISVLDKLLNIPLEKNTLAPDVNAIPLRPVAKPQKSTPNAQTEYTIKDSDYLNILRVLRHEGRSFERTPKTFHKLGEEELRDIILAHLNGHYQGLANGEAFRNKGKTDICIEFENRAAFVGECKEWSGEKKLKETLDQLLGYLTWRDCKASLIIFNKNVKGFSDIQDKIAPALRQHDNFIRENKHNDAGEWQFVFSSAQDNQREITVHVFLFNIYAEKRETA